MVSDGSGSAAPSHPPPRRRRRRRRVVILAASLLALVLILITLDRAAAAYAENRVAEEIQGRGFPQKPDVTVQGFPFLTQLISRDLTGVQVRSAGLRAGPVDVSLEVLATDIKLNSSYNGGVISQASGTGVIAFSSVAGAARTPGLTVSANGPHQLKLAVDLEFFTATAIADVTRAGPDAVRIRVVSVNGVPLSLLGPVSDFVIRVPPLPLGLTIRSVSISGQGVVVHITGHDIAFGQ